MYDQAGQAVRIIDLWRSACGSALVSHGVHQSRDSAAVNLPFNTKGKLMYLKVVVTMIVLLVTNRKRSMYTHLLRFVLFAITIQLAFAFSLPASQTGAHFCGVTDYPSPSHWSFKPHTRLHYARTFASNTNINAPGMVRLIYLLPNDRQARPERVSALRQLINDAQAFFADEMQRHGYGRKTFTVETDTMGTAIVHQIDGRFSDDYYYTGTSDFKVWAELLEHFGDVDALQHVYFIAIVLSYEALNDGQSGGLGGVIFNPVGRNIGFGPEGQAKLRHRDITTGEEALGGFALIPAFGHNFERLGLTLHELGHAFGLDHDFRKGRHGDYVMGFGNATRLSKCAAEWLSVNRFFNTASTFHNDAGAIELLSLEAYSDYVLNIRFKVTDPDGLHQAQLLVPDILPNPEWAGWGPFRLFDCNPLTGTTRIVDTVVRSAEIVDRITLQIMDLNGNITWATFPVEPDALLPARNTLDVNSDGIVGLADLELLGSHFGQRASGPTDVNSDGVVDIVDVLLVVYAISFESPDPDVVHQLAVTDVEQWLINAKHREIENEALQIGLTELEEIFAVLTDVVVEIPDANLRAVLARALRKAEGDSITSSEMNTLTYLDARNVDISDLTGLEFATKLTVLKLGVVWVEGQGWVNSNAVTDLSPLAGLTDLTQLELRGNSISDISPLAGLTNLTRVSLEDNSVSDLSLLSGLTNLTELELFGNRVSDISPLSGLINLTWLQLFGNNIEDLSPLSGLTDLRRLALSRNGISDISPLSSLTRLETLGLSANSISDISPLAGLTNLARLGLRRNNISDLSPVAGLANLERLDLRHNYISNISPLVVNTGVGSGDEVLLNDNPLNASAINSDVPTLQSRGVEVHFDNLKPPILEYLWAMPAGTSLIHVPLKVTAVDGVEQTIISIADLYDALGGADTVNFLITYDADSQDWISFFGASDRGTPANIVLTDDTGILAGMKRPVSVQLSGEALGEDGSSSINLKTGLNMVALPLNDSRVTRVSDLLALNGIGGNVPVIILTDNGDFKAVGRAGDPGDIPITGGQAFILTAQQAAQVTIAGQGWTNVSGVAAAPLVAEVTDTTPVLALRGAVVDERTGAHGEGFRVTVKNLSIGKAITGLTTGEAAGYRLTVVDTEMARAAMTGDVLEVSARSANPQIGVKPLRYTVTADDVRRSLIELPELVIYEIPAETKLLANYPNPFNPETWIPYRLASDGYVTLTIYDLSGRVVRTLDVGHRVAAVYESRSKAIYFDSRNQFGETVASGVYFYHLLAGDYSATQRMLIVK